MNRFTTITVLVVAYLVVSFQSMLDPFRHWLGVQIDLLPGLMVYASLSGGIFTVLSVAVCGGLWLDSLSANPLGISVLPLFLAGLLIQRSRELLLREQAFAQFLLGTLASAAVPLLTVLLLFNADVHPLVGWFSLWQWLVVAIAGGAFTPLWFLFFQVLGDALTYRLVGESSFRPDRQLKRGRQ